MSKNYITLAGFTALNAEFHQLDRVERPQLLNTIAWAAANGDRSENADYIYGKKRLREIERRLRYLIKRMEQAEVVDNTGRAASDGVYFGATITVEDEQGQVQQLRIVGEDEIAPERGAISWKAPLSRALLGKQVGADVEVHSPAGMQFYRLLAVSYE